MLVKKVGGIESPKTTFRGSVEKVGDENSGRALHTLFL
jgi:hypothetical protein